MFAHPDFLLVFAAGNSGEDAKGTGRIDPGSVSSPGTAKNALTVGASKNLVATGGIQKKLSELHDGAKKWGAEPIASEKLSDNPNGLAMFSSRGPTQDGRIKPEVVAPGTNILSTRSHQPDSDKLWGEYNSEYLWCGGTSMATPLVAGAATVVREYLVKDRHLANPSAALVKGVLMHTAFDMFPGQFGAVGAEHGQELLTKRPNSDEGYGRVDMDKATGLSSALIIDEKAGVATGEAQSYPVHVNHSGHMVVTMVYTDAPAAENVSKSLVNDLDLVIVDSSGHETSLNDHTNNSEMVQMDALSGDYTVRVKGTNVPQGQAGKQPYALLVSVE
jgi:serine protease AprX